MRNTTSAGSPIFVTEVPGRIVGYRDHETAAVAGVSRRTLYESIIGQTPEYTVAILNLECSAEELLESVKFPWEQKPQT